MAHYIHRLRARNHREHKMNIGNALFDWQADLDGVTVQSGEFVVVTADCADHRNYQAVTALLKRIRKVLGLEVLFVTQFLDGQPLVRYPSDTETDSACDPLEEAYGSRLLMSQPGVNAAFALPVEGREGWVYGTVCCARHADDRAWGDRSQLDALNSVARLVASTLDDSLAPLTSDFAPLHGAPLEQDTSFVAA